MAFNSDHFNLRNWKLTLPVDNAGKLLGTASEIKNLNGFESSKSFYDAEDGAMVFRASTDGATTSGSKYARSELREMDGTRAAAWDLQRGGVMTATLEVNAVPLKADGTPGRLIVGQIHGQNEELIRLYWENGTVYFMNDQAGPSNSETKFVFKDAHGSTPNISLNERFSYKIDAHRDTLSVDIFVDGQVYSSVSKINSVWQSDTFYFKAGVYLGINETNGSGSGQASFFGLEFGHTEGVGLGGWKAGAAPTSPQPTDPVGEIAWGTVGADALNGTSDDDVISALSGNDTIYGGRGSDTISTGSGNDLLVYKSAADGIDIITDFSTNDRIDLSAVFTKITGFNASEAFDAGYVRTIINGNDIQLWVDLDGTKGTGAAIQIGTFIDGKLGNISLSSFVLTDGPAEPAKPTLPSAPAPSRLTSGDNHDNSIVGTDGKDIIQGKGGNDVLSGGLGNDEIWGNSGSDTIVGGLGKDWIKGGDGADKYVFRSLAEAGDTISDYRKGEKIDISGIVEDLPFKDDASFATLRELGFVAMWDAGHFVNNLFVDFDGFAGSGEEIMIVKIVGMDDSVRDGGVIIF